MSDPLRTLLDDLAPDVAHTRLADPSAVRRRGEQRTHRKIAGVAVLGAAAVVVVAVLGTSHLHSLADNPTPPAASQPPTPTPSAISSAAGGPVPLLSSADLPDSRDGRWRIVPAPSIAPLGTCVDVQPTPGNPVEATSWYATKADPAAGDEQALNAIIGAATPQDAHDLLRKAESQAQTCWRATLENAKVHAGDEAVFLYGSRDVGLSDAVNIQGIVLVRVGSKLAVFAGSVDGNGDLPYYDALKAQVPQQLAQILVGDGATPDS